MEPEIPVATEIQLVVIVAEPILVENKRRFRYNDYGRIISFLFCITIMFVVIFLSYK